MICVNKISVQFTSLEGFQRKPIAHTSGAVLERPRTYESFPQLRQEFNSILHQSGSMILFKKVTLVFLHVDRVIYQCCQSYISIMRQFSSNVVGYIVLIVFKTVFKEGGG